MTDALPTGVLDPCRTRPRGREPSALATRSSSLGVAATGVCLKFKRAMPGLMLMALLPYFQLAQVGTESFVDILSDDDGFRRYYRRY